jgi:hypothetical protein
MCRLTQPAEHLQSLCVRNVRLVLRQVLVLGLAVLALAAVAQRRTGASAQTANSVNPNL